MLSLNVLAYIQQITELVTTTETYFLCTLWHARSVCRRCHGYGVFLFVSVTYFSRLQ